MFQILWCIRLDSKLKWKKQVDMLCNKLKQQKYIIQQASTLLPLDSLKLLYYSYIHSNILYGAFLWGSVISKVKHCSIGMQTKKGYSNNNETE